MVKFLFRNCSANKKGRRVFVIFLVLRTKKITKTLPFFWLAEQLPYFYIQRRVKFYVL